MMGWRARARSFVAVAGLVAAVMVDDGAALSAGSHMLRYRVVHSTYGDIGTYSNTIEQTGDTTTVLTEAHFKVSILGVVLHREDAKRTERWQGGRLVYFSGVTTKNGKPMELQGEARGDSFVIDSPRGVVTAPADVHPANPWSANFLGSDTMMSVDTGAIEPVRISDGEAANVTIDGRPLRARKYEIRGKIRYKIWLSEADQVPVMFSVDDDSGVVTFTLAQK
jgi:translation initiation factor IF-1